MVEEIGKRAAAIGGLAALLGLADAARVAIGSPPSGFIAGFGLALVAALLYGLAGAALGALAGFFDLSIRVPLPVFAAIPLGAMIVGGIAARPLPSPGEAAGSPVILLTIDTLRRDAVGAYGAGSGPSATPNLDALAASGALFLDAVTPTPETVPAHASMLTGAHPLRHRALTNGHPLPADVPTAAEILARSGFPTGAFVSSHALTSRTGLDRGFTVYDDGLAPGPAGWPRLIPASLGIRAWIRFGWPASSGWLLERSGDRTVAAALRWVDKVGDRPFFLWVHLFEPHAPYAPPDPASALDHRARMDTSEPWTPQEIAELRALYRGEVAEADRIAGALISGLKSRGVLDRATVIVAGDHGEMLGEHGLVAVHEGLYEEVVRVPLIVRPPAPPKVSRVEGQVRLFDVFRSILDGAGVELPESEGFSLLDYTRGRRSKPLPAVLVGHTGRSLSAGAVMGRRAEGWKYLVSVPSGPEALYALGSDPGEATDLILAASDDLARMRSALGPDRAAFEALLGAPGRADDLLPLLGYQNE